MFRYHNANPRGRRVNDCTVRAISLATGRTWDATYEELTRFAQAQAIMPDEVNYIDEYLGRNFERVFCSNCRNKKTVGQITKKLPRGIYLITMNGHITCCINGVIYDTFDPSDYFVWEIYKV
jgi:hypothetical protein